MLRKELNDKVIKVMISHTKGRFFCCKHDITRQEYLTGDINNGKWENTATYYDTVTDIREILHSMVDEYVITSIIGFPIVEAKAKLYVLPKYETILRDYFASICPTTMDPLGRYEWADKMLAVREGDV